MLAKSAQSLSIVALAVLLGASSSAPAQKSKTAQAPDEEPPLVGRLRGYSHVVGTYRIRYTAEPTEVVVEDPVTMKIRITGKGPQKYQPKGDLLRPFADEVQHDFYIERVPDQDRLIPGKNGENTWEFVYRLRPKSTRVTKVPEPRLVYYLPLAGYRTAYCPPEDPEILLTVKARPKLNPQDLNLSAIKTPDRLYELASGDDVLAQERTWLYWNPPLLLAVGLAIPFLNWLGFMVYRWLVPDVERQLRRRRSQAARRAVRELNRVRGACPVALLAKVLAGYLSQRLDLGAAEPTPAEVFKFLRRRGVAAQLGQQWTQLFRTLDEIRYTPPTPSAGSTPSLPDRTWPGRAVNLIHALEADPCLASRR